MAAVKRAAPVAGETDPREDAEAETAASLLPPPLTTLAADSSSSGSSAEETSSPALEM